MKLKLFIVIIALTTSLISFSFSEKSKNATAIKKSVDTAQNILYLYGEYIYKRENCNKCHSLTQTQNLTLLSLDGLQNKYSKSWHYYHLIDPRLVVTDSKMQSFAFLSDKIFTKDSIDSKIFTISQKHWNNLLDTTKQIKQLFKTENINVMGNSEILALIYFLDNIPTSNELKIIQEKKSEKIAEEQRIMDSLWKNSESTIITYANNKQNVKRGQKLFQTKCTPCHGRLGEGMIGPNLTDNYWIHGSSVKSIAKTITNGVPERGMIPWRYELVPTEVGQLVAYINSIKGSNPPNAKEKQGKKE